jgi:ribose transport system permease protein
MRAWRSDPLRLGDNWPVLVFAALFALDVALKGRFSAFDLRTLCVNVLPLSLIALAQFFVVLTRGIDLSLGPIASVASSCAALLLTDNMAVGFLVPLAVGAAAGLLNGVLVVGFALPPIIVTLATMSLWQGVALLVLPQPGGEIPEVLPEILSGSYILPVALWLIIVVLGFGTWVMSTRFGLHLRAIGDDPVAARLSGIRVRRVGMLAYTLAGVIAAISGLVLAVATSSGSPIIGDDYILVSIATVVLGGVPLVGGRGSVLGVIMGALTLTIIGSLLYFAEISSFYQSTINGVILLAVVASQTTRLWLLEMVRGLGQRA